MIIKPAKRVRGRITLPGDKSISHRAAMVAALANGASRISNYSTSADSEATLACLRQLGVQIAREGNEVSIQGVGGDGLRAPDRPLDCGNSGTTMRLLAGILAGQNLTSVLTGDASLRSRPMQRIIEPLGMMGAEISSFDGCAPLTIRGRNPLQPVDYKLLVASAQVKSSILLAGLNAKGRTTVIEEAPTRDHTERLLGHFGVPVEIGKAQQQGQTFAAVSGPATFAARDVDVPGDISAAAYFIAAAALLGESSVEIPDVGVNPTRVAFLTQLQELGYDIEITNVRQVNNEPVATIRISGCDNPRSAKNSEARLTVDSLSIPQLIDELPLLAVVGSQIDGGLEIRDASELRAKESDRIATTIAGLRAMGAHVEEFEDGLRVSGSTKLRGAKIDPRGDHRIAMTFTIAALLADGESEIQDADCVAVSFPEFFDLLDSMVER